MSRLDATAQRAANGKTAPSAGGATCLECAAPLRDDSPHADRADFCGTPCRRAFNNRRAQRGAAFYDLIMALRYQRDEATELKVWRQINRLAAAYRDEDMHERGGRPSWRPPRTVLMRMPWLRAEVFAAPKRRQR
ncbi:MAG TPA: hypothetical protein VK973_05805 [Arenicellales bacterium]|nr:hypothetical protein [Arenicellales bacterium]